MFEQKTYLTKVELVELLAEFPDNMPLVLTGGRTGYQFGFAKEDVKVLDGAAFCVDLAAAAKWCDGDKDYIEKPVLQIGIIDCE